jgi:hypothetical protein
MGMGGAQDGCVEHIGKIEIGRIDGGTADPFISVDAGERLADDLRLFPGIGILPRPGCFGNRDVLGVI